MSKPVTMRCPVCGHRNEAVARSCKDCGRFLPEVRVRARPSARAVILWVILIAVILGAAAWLIAAGGA